MFGLDENADRCPGCSLYDYMASDDHMILDGGCDMHACYAILQKRENETGGAKQGEGGR